MMTLDEMKLAVCEKLPELIIYTGNQNSNIYSLCWIGKYEINWPTEGLQVCHEAEKLLTPALQHRYAEVLYDLVATNLLDYSGVYYEGEQPDIDFGELFSFIHFTYEQRLEALCRVWYPERF